MPRPNWFFGFPLDGTFVDQLTDVPTSLRRYHADDVHLTLAFLGLRARRSRACPRGSRRALESAPVLAIDATLGEVVPMGGSRRDSPLSPRCSTRVARKQPRASPTSATRSLWQRAGREKRPAKPHVTIARPLRRASDEARAGARLGGGARSGGVRARLDRIALCLYTWSENRRERLFRIDGEAAPRSSSVSTARWSG
jgi:2'-5' RNA ligase